jgi:hypothetical protein
MNATVLLSIAIAEAYLSAHTRPIAVAVGIALGEYTFHDSVMRCTYGSQTVR